MIAAGNFTPVPTIIGSTLVRFAAIFSVLVSVASCHGSSSTTYLLSLQCSFIFMQEEGVQFVYSVITEPVPAEFYRRV